MELYDEFVDSVLEADSVDNVLREYIKRDNFLTLHKTIDKCCTHSLMKKRFRLFDQSVKAFENGYSDLAVIGFTSVFDGLLADVSKNPMSSLKPRVNVIITKLENNECLDQNEYASLAFAITYYKTVISFSENSDFSGQEPKCLNRHWIAHGRSTRKKTKLDCVKMINLIYGLLLIEKCGSTKTAEELGK